MDKSEERPAAQAIKENGFGREVSIKYKLDEKLAGSVQGLILRAVGAGADLGALVYSIALIALYILIPFFLRGAAYHLDIPFLLKHCYLFPAGILIASLAMSSGAAAANFWMPLYLWLGINARLAFWVVLISMGFGFGSGVLRHWRQGTYDRSLMLKYLSVALPGAVLGSYLSAVINPSGLVFGFCLFLIGYGSRMLVKPDMRAKSSRAESFLIGSIGGILKGMISVGLEMIIPGCIKESRDHKKVPGTLVMIIFFTNNAIILLKLLFDSELRTIITSHSSFLVNLLYLVLPGVVLGGQIGPRIQLSKSNFIRYVGSLFVLLGMAILVELCTNCVMS